MSFEGDIRMCDEWMKINELSQRLAAHLYAQAVSKPVGVNDETQPDYEALAQECAQKAQEVTPPLLRALGLLPKEEA